MATIFLASLYFGFQSLYATLVCVAGSQLEKLRAALLDIRQTHGTSLQDCGGEIHYREAAAQKNTHSEQFRHMQEQLNNCVRHHQEIKR
jgi:signal transduction histidine kinase